MNIRYLTTKEELDELYNQSALTWEGLLDSEESFNSIKEWLEQNNINTGKLAFSIVKSSVMNILYNLTGTNAYPDDLSIISVTGINVMPIIFKRFEVGGRWFDDIVDNNLAREESNNETL